MTISEVWIDSGKLEHQSNCKRKETIGDLRNLMIGVSNGDSGFL
jgi:hypothetical protein